ncbi:MAG: hypothetical protein SGJ21_14635 [Alphaproteobacteria bacterium]|nr:hypothetical protein [Alphaproteobacteria bacterium]
MEIIWRYVKRVKKSLPTGRRIQQVGELYTTLKQKLATEELALGRKATTEEVDAMLSAYGQPEAVAARISISGPGSHLLVERYLAAVGRRLPPGQQSDIVAELREAITAKIETVEGGTGATASKADVSDILKSFGNPLIVASRYTGRDHLIGPDLYPYFWPAQRAAIGVGLIVVIAIASVRALGMDEPARMIPHVLNDAFHLAIFALGAVTGVFVGLDRTGAGVKLVAGWNPALLPDDHVRAPKGLFDSVFALAWDAIFILWWVKAVTFPNQLPGRSGEGGASLLLSDAWAPLYLPVLALALLTAAVHVADILHPGWSRLRATVSMAGYGAGLVLLWVLIRAGSLVEVVGVGEGAERLQRLANGSALWVLSIVAFVWTCALCLEGWRLLNGFHPRLSPKA